VCEAIIFAQARQGQVCAATVERMHATAPLARLILLLGSWCEGDSRASQTPAGMLRVYWHQFIARAQREWLQTNEPAGMWTLSRTAMDNDQLLHTADQLPPQRSGLIAIHAESLITYECLAEMCGVGGWSTIWLAPRQPIHLQRASVLLWDMPQSVEADFQAWQSQHEQLRPAASVILVGFPRSADVENLREAGAAAVLAKPLVIADLLSVLDCATRSGEELIQRRAG